MLGRGILGPGGPGRGVIHNPNQDPKGVSKIKTLTKNTTKKKSHQEVGVYEGSLPLYV